MLQLEWTVLAQSYSIDRDRGNVSVFNILDELTLPKETPSHDPSAPGAVNLACVVVQSWLRDTKDDPEELVEPRMRIEDPSGATLGESKSQLLFRQSRRARNVTSILMLPFTVPGGYQF